jgi:hypothetical protein
MHLNEKPVTAAELLALAGIAKPKIETVPVREYGVLKDWPEWACEIPVVNLTEEELKELPEYSATLPDSYKRPVDQGGRPWKRDLNFFGKFGNGKKWVRCEYVTDPDPKFLAVKNERVEIQ